MFTNYSWVMNAHVHQAYEVRLHNTFPVVEVVMHDERIDQGINLLYHEVGVPAVLIAVQRSFSSSATRL